MVTIGITIARTDYSSAQTVADRGERIYKEQFQDASKKNISGQYVVIDILTKRAYMAVFPEEAINKATAEAPDGLFHLVKIEPPPAAFKLPLKSFSIDSLN
jgi:hypothetical protein